MARSCAVVLLLGALVLGVRGDEGTTDSNASNVAANTTTTQPRPSHPVVMFLVKTNNTQGYPANGTVIETVLDAVQENISDPAGPSDVVLITVLQIPEDNGTENASNITVELRNSLKGIDEDTHNRLKRSVDSDAPLVRKKRNSHKKRHRGGYSGNQQSYCGQCSQPRPCNNCGMQYNMPQHQPYPSPCGGGPCRGGGGYYSSATSSSQAMSGYMGRKKK